MHPPPPTDLLQHARFLRGIVRGLLADEASVEDVLQETWATAIERPPPRTDNVRGWLGVVARNFALKRRRGEARRRGRERAVAKCEAVPGPAEAVAMLEWHRHVVDAVLRLEPSLRTLVVGRFYEELATEELARRAGVTPRTIARHLQEALAALRADLDGRAAGSRRVWASALAPSLAAGGSLAGAALTTGGIAMGTKVVVGTVVAAVAVAIGFAWDRGAPMPAGPGAASEDAAVRSAVEPPRTLVARPSETPSPAPTGELRLRGRVFDERGRPAAGVPIEVRETVRPTRGAPQAAQWIDRLFQPPSPEGRLLGRTTSGDDGGFTFPGLGREGAYRLRAVPEPPHFGTSTTVFPERSEPPPQVLRVGPGSPLQVRVVGIGDGDRAWVRVGLAPRSRGDAPEWRVDATRTDGQGRLALPSAPDGLLWIAVLVPGHGEWGFDVLLPSTEEVVLDVGGGRRAVVEGRVLDAAGTPVPSARVAVTTMSAASGGRSEVACAVTDESGRYRVRVTPGRLGGVFATAAGFLASRRTGRDVEVGAEATATIDVVMERGGALRGVVRDGEGRPFPRATVVVETHHANDTWTVQGTADDEGRYRLDPLPPGEAHLQATAPGLYFPEQDADGTWRAARTGPTSARIAGDGSETVRDLVLLRGLRLGGTTQGGDGPLGGVTVTALRVEEGGRGVSVQMPMPHDAAEATSDPAGRFELAGLPPGLWRVEARRGALRSAQTEPVRLVPGQAPEPLALRLEPTGSIAGRVVRPDGAPVPRATLLVTPPVPGTVPVAPDGTFRVEALAEGTYGLRAVRGLVEASSSPIPVRAGEEVRDVVLTLPAHGAIGGVVLDDTGRPVPDVQVVIVRGDGRPATTSRPTTDRDGAFFLDGLPDDAYRLEVAGRDAAAVTARPGDEDVRLVVGAPPQDRLIRILDPEGRPVPLVALTLMTGTGGSTSGALEEATGGTYRVPGPKFAGYVELVVSSPRDAAGRPLDLRGVRVRNLRPRPEPLEIRLPAGRRLDGVVVDDAGEPVPGMGVVVASAEASEGPKARGEDVVDAALDPTGGAGATTAPDGTFVVRGLPLGPLRVRARPQEDFVPGEWMDVPAGAEAVTLRLLRGAVVEGLVQGPDGAPVEGARVEATMHQGGRGWMRRSTTDAQGAFRVTGIPPERPFLLKAAVPRSDLLAAFADAVAPGARGVVLRLEAGRHVTGRVLGPDGSPARGAQAIAEPLPRASPRRMWQYARVGEDGTFDLRGLDGGAYRIRATDESGAFAPSPSVEVSPPASDVTLRMRPAGRIVGTVLGGSEEGMQVSWRSGETEVVTPVRKDGSFEMRGIPEEPGTLYVGGSAATRYALLRDVRPSSTRLEIPLAPAERISGRLEPRGPADAYVTILFLGEGYVAGPAWVAPDGGFEARGLPPGVYRLRVTVDGDSADLPEPVTAGATDVVVRVPPPR